MIYHSGTGRYYLPLSNGMIYILASCCVPPTLRVHYIMSIINLFEAALYTVNRLSKGLPMPYIETTFVNLKLSEKDKTAFKKWAVEQVNDLDMHLTNLILGGHKLSLSYSEKNQSYSCAITCRDKTSVNVNKCVVSMHKSPYDALWVALYKHVKLLGDSDWTDVVGEDDWG